MRTTILIAVMCSACATGDEGATAQAVAGPGGVTASVRAAGQLAVNWSADPAAVKYYVFQGAGGGLPSFVASVLDSSGGPPSTSYIATGLSDGVRYCYAIESAYADGTMSDLGAPGCASASGGAPQTRQITIPIPASVARVSSAMPAASLQSGLTSWLVASTGELVYPLPVAVGDTINGFRVFGNKGSGSGTRLAATLMVVQSAHGSASGSATDSNQLAAPGAFALTVAGLSTPVVAGNSYVIQADSTTGIPLDLWLDAEVTITLPD